MIVHHDTLSINTAGSTETNQTIRKLIIHLEGRFEHFPVLLVVNAYENPEPVKMGSPVLLRVFKN